MANTKSAIKNIRKNQARYLRNRMVISRLKTLEKKFLFAIESKDKAKAEEASSLFISALEKAKKSSLVHSNKVSRKKNLAALCWLLNFQTKEVFKYVLNHLRLLTNNLTLVGYGLLYFFSSMPEKHLRLSYP